MHSSAGLYGADLQLLALAGGLRSRGWETSAVLPVDGPLRGRLEAAGCDVVVQPLAVLRRRLLNPLGLARLALDARSERPRLRELASAASLVHSNTSVILGGQRAADSAGIPHVLHVREIYAGLADRFWPLWRRRLMRADALVCVSSAVAAQFNGGDQGGRAEAVSVVHDGVAAEGWTVDHRIGGQMSNAPFAVAILGRIADWKGQDVLIRALAEPALAEIGARAVIAGGAYPGEQAPDIATLARTLGVDDRVEMIGFTPNPEQVLASVDAVAVPSTRPDPLPNSALEALAAGRPVVAAAHGGLREIVKDGETGFLVEPGNAQALATALRRLADDPELRAGMGEAATADARERFTIERMLDEVEALYAQLGVRR